MEGWHNGFQVGISCAHPSFTKLLRYLQLKHSLQEAILTKWESGETMIYSRESIARNNNRTITIVSDFGNREPLSYLKGIALNLLFNTSYLPILHHNSYFSVLHHISYSFIIKTSYIYSLFLSMIVTVEWNYICIIEYECIQ